MQLDVEVSPPANFKGSLSALKQNAFPFIISRMNYCLVRFFVTDRQNMMHKSPPCMGSGGLKNYCSLHISFTD